MDIEEVAEESPEDIRTYPINFETGLESDLAEEICTYLELAEGKQYNNGVDQLQKLYKMFVKLDSTQVEINPWAVTPEDELCCIDAKIGIDDNALFRQQKCVDMMANSKASEAIDENEKKATDLGLNYIGLDGNIGCIVNGAGLAMATMDIINSKGASPANFLDVGGSASGDQIAHAFSILTASDSVKSILINIFGGIMKCDTVAAGIIQASQQVKVDIPLVVRLTGTNYEKAFELLEDFTAKNPDLNLTIATDMDDAASKAVASLNL